jgi:hypothetical protein
MAIRKNDSASDAVTRTAVVDHTVDGNLRELVSYIRRQEAKRCGIPRNVARLLQDAADIVRCLPKNRRPPTPLRPPAKPGCFKEIRKDV